MDVDFSDLQNNSGAGGNGGGGDDITSDLLQKFSCMNTNDREVLIQQFKKLLGDRSATTNVEFWLDMNNWNLEAAVCAYFDHDGSNNALSPFSFKLPSMTFTPNEGNFDRMPTNTPFFYQCIITNSGDEPWPVGCTLRFVGGTQLSSEERILLPSLSAGQSAEVKFSFISPPVAGGHECTWRPATLTGQFFGETIFIIINVFDDLSTVAQQLSNAHLMDATEGNSSSSSSLSFQQRSNALQTPLPLCTVTPLGTQNSPLSPWDVNQSSSSSSSTNHNSTVATSDMYNNHLPPMSPSTFTAGMCLPGSTAAGHLPENHFQMMGNGIEHQQNAFLGGTPPSAQNMAHNFQQANSPLMLTHLSQPPSASSPSAAASQHEPIDDSMS